MFGFRVNPPDTIGDVGPNHYVQMVNVVFGVFSKSGERLLGPINIGALWAGFAIDECTDPSGDPVVFYDQFADRWLLTQFTTRGLSYPNEPLNLFTTVSRSRQPVTRPARTTATRSPPGTTSQIIPNTASGAIPTWSPRVNSACSTPKSTASAPTASNATR